MDLSNYAGLRTTIAEYVGRDDLSNEIVTFIRLAEVKFARVLRTLDMQVGPVALTLASDGSVNVPADFVEVRALYTLGATGATLDAMPFDTAAVLNGAGARGSAYGYSLGNGVLQTVPGGAGSISLTYQAKFVPLSLTQTTNWLLSEHPDVYLYGALAETGRYTGDATVDWGAQCAAMIDDLMQADTRKRWAGGRVRPAGPTP